MANIVFLILGLMVGVLGLIGFLDAVRGTPVAKVLPFGSELPAVDDPAFRTSMELVSRTAICPGNDAEIFWKQSFEIGRPSAASAAS